MTDDLPRTLIDIARAGMAPNHKDRMMRTALEHYDTIVADHDGETEAANDYFRACVHQMDEDLREELHDMAFPGVDDDHREFLRRYSEAHEQKFGNPFVCN